MILDFKKIHSGRIQQPLLRLQTLSNKELGVIPFVHDLEFDIRYADVSEISFTVPYMSDGKVNPLYDKIDSYKVVYTDDFGIYIIVSPEKNGDGVKESKSVHGYSIEKLFEKKRLYLEDGTYEFYNPNHPDGTIIGRVLEAFSDPSWSVGRIDTRLYGCYRKFDEYDSDILSFCYSSAPERYRCIIVFDVYNKTINAYDTSIDAVNSTLPIYLSYKNLIDTVGVNEITDDIVTKLHVYGSDGLSIREVNPTGDDYVLNFNFFIDNGDLDVSVGGGDKLEDKVAVWERLIDDYRSEYVGLIASRASKRSQKISEEAALKEMETELQTLLTRQSMLIQEIELAQSDTERQTIRIKEDGLNATNDKIDLKRREISEQEWLINYLESVADGYTARINQINKVLSIKTTTVFTSEERNILMRYLIEDEVTDDTFVATDVDTSVSGTVSKVRGIINIEKVAGDTYCKDCSVVDCSSTLGDAQNRLDACVLEYNKCVSSTNNQNNISGNVSIETRPVVKKSDMVSSGWPKFVGDYTAIYPQKFSVGEDGVFSVIATPIVVDQSGNVSIMSKEDLTSYIEDLEASSVDDIIANDGYLSRVVVFAGETNSGNIDTRLEKISVVDNQYCDIKMSIGSNIIEEYSDDIDTLCDEFDRLSGYADGNGNVSYSKRPLVLPDIMRKKYPEFEGDIATTYFQTQTIGDVSGMYTIMVTPILEDGSVLSQKELDEYCGNLQTSNGKDRLLDSDISRIVINVRYGDYNEEYWDGYINSLDAVKQEHWELIQQIAEDNNLDIGYVIKQYNAFIQSSSGVTQSEVHTKETFAISGGRLDITTPRISAYVVRGTVEYGTTSHDYTMSAQLGTTTYAGKSYPSGMITIHGYVDWSVVNAFNYTGEKITINALGSSDAFFTVSVTEYQKYSVAQELYDYGTDVLSEVAYPTYEFDINSGNFLFIDEFAAFKDKLALGKGVHLGLGSDGDITANIIGIHLNFEDPTNYTMEFSNRFQRRDGIAKWAKSDKTYSSAAHSFNSSKYIYNRAANKTTQVSKFMDGQLNAATNTIIGAKNQSVVIDGAGIHVGGDSPYQIRIVDSMIAMSDNGFNTPTNGSGAVGTKIGIGRFASPDVGEVWGVNAEMLVGKAVITEKFIMEDVADNGITMFKLDTTGAWLYNSRIVLQGGDSGGQLLIDHRYGIVAGSNGLFNTSGTSVTPRFIDNDGDIINDSKGFPTGANFFLDIKTGNAYFRGTVYADKLSGKLTGDLDATGSNAWLKGCGIKVGKKTGRTGEDASDYNFYVDTSGNVTMTGSITWSSDSSPVRVQYSTNGSGTEAGSWHDTINENDYFARYSYDGGITWTNVPVQIRGVNGRNGDDASVTLTSINSVLGNIFTNVVSGSPTEISNTKIWAPIIEGGNIYGITMSAGSGKGFAQMYDQGMRVYDNSTPGQLKITLGYYTSNYNYPYIGIGSGSTSTPLDAGLIMKFTNGLWVGTNDVLTTPSLSNTSPPVGTNTTTGFFVDFNDKKIYQYIAGVKTAIGSGSGGTAIAVFG